MDQKNLDIDGGEPIPWSRAREQHRGRRRGTSWWLATVRPDGRPHVAAVGALWVDGRFYVTSGPGTLKSRTLARNSSSPTKTYRRLTRPLTGP